MGTIQSYQNAFKEYEAAFSYSDVLIELQTLSDIKQGWKFILNPKDKTNIPEKMSHQPNYILGFLGRESNLKANLINKLCGYSSLTQNIQGLDHFKGLKIRFSHIKTLNDTRQEKDKLLKPNHKILTCFSSTNTEFPVYFHKDEEIFKMFSKCHEIGHVLSDVRSINKLDNKKYEHLKFLMMNDKYTTESFLERFIMFISDIIIIVVKEINFEDQKFIEKVSAEYKHKKKVLVIHYFENQNSSIQIKQAIDKQIKGFFLVKEVPMNLKAFYPNIKDKEGEKMNRMLYVGETINEPSSLINPDDRNCVIHLVYAREETKMGKYYNKTTIDYIYYLIKKNFPNFKEFKLTDSFRSFFYQSYMDYFQINKKNEKNPLDIQVFEEMQFKNKYIKPTINFDIKYLTDPKYDVLGRLVNVNTSDFSPPYHMIERKNGFDIIVEVPLLKPSSLKVKMDRSDTTFQFLLVMGEKNNNIDIEKDMDNKILSTRGNLEWGKFTLKIPIAPYSVRLKKKRDIEYKEGLVLIRLVKGEDFEHQMVTEDDLKLSNINLEKNE